MHCEYVSFQGRSRPQDIRTIEPKGSIGDIRDIGDSRDIVALSSFKSFTAVAMRYTAWSTCRCFVWMRKTHIDTRGEHGERVWG